MNYKLLIIELFQATAFAMVLTFLIATLGLERIEYIGTLTFFAFMLGGIPMMLAKRFLVSVIKEIKYSKDAASNNPKPKDVG